MNGRQLELLSAVSDSLIEAINVYKKTEDLTILISYLYRAQKGFDSSQSEGFKPLFAFTATRKY